MKKNSNCRDNCVKLDGHVLGTIIDVSTKFEAIRRTFCPSIFDEKCQRGVTVLTLSLKEGVYFTKNLKRGYLLNQT